MDIVEKFCVLSSNATLEIFLHSKAEWLHIIWKSIEKMIMDFFSYK